MVRLVRESLGPCGRAGQEVEQRSVALLSSSHTLPLPLVPHMEGAKRRGRSERRFKIAVHVRRGDSCVRWAQHGDSKMSGGCPCFRAQEYMIGVRALIQQRRVAKVRLLVASDSMAAVADLVKLAHADGMEVEHVQAIHTPTYAMSSRPIPSHPIPFHPIPFSSHSTPSQPTSHHTPHHTTPCFPYPPIIPQWVLGAARGMGMHKVCAVPQRHHLRRHL